LSYTFDQIIVSNGAKHSLMNAIFTLVNPNDEVIIPAPYWVSYLEMVKLAEGKTIVLKTTGENDYKITPAQLEKAITSATKVLMLNSPSNPSGSIYSYQELADLVDVLKKHPEIWVISDEIYEYINYEGQHVSIASFPGMIERTVIINGVSKGFAMTGWRIGFLAAPKHIAKACEKLQGQQTSGPSSISQMAAIAAYSGGLDATIEMRKTFRRRRNLILSLIKEIDGINVNTPPGAFYIFPDISSYFGKQFNGKIIENADQLAIYLIEQGHVASVSGIAFGSPENIRLSYATSDDNITEAIKRLKKALQNLK
jgi:aspartate aminotransferase